MNKYMATMEKRAAVTLLIMMLTAMTAWADALAGGGDRSSAVALEDVTDLAGGWYKVESDLSIDHTVTLHGDTYLIISSGATFTIDTSDDYGIQGFYAFTVGGKGSLHVSANCIAIGVSAYTQTGCSVNAVGSACGIYGHESGVSIIGGQVTVSGGGIKTYYGDITLGWTEATDFIKASSYAADCDYAMMVPAGQTDGFYATISGYKAGDEAVVKISDGQMLRGGGNNYSGTLSATQMTALSDVKLSPVTLSGTCGVVDVEAGLDGSEVTWNFDPAMTTLTIGGVGAMFFDEQPWSVLISQIKTVVIGDGVTVIVENAFNNHTALTSVTIGSGVMSIGEDAFYGCVAVTDVYCYANPSVLTWNDGYSDDFKDGEETKCHVSDVSAWSGFSHVNVTFEGDLSTIPFTLTESDGVSPLSTLVGKTLSVEFKRTFNMNSNGDGRASTICLPFNFAKPDKETIGAFATFTSVSQVSGEYVVTMTEVPDATKTLTAGTPYLFKPATGDEVTFKNDAWTVPATMKAGKVEYGGWEFTGTYAKQTWDSGQTRLYGFASADFKESGTTIDASQVGTFRRYDYGYCNTFRCYLWAPDPAGARGVSAAPGSLPESMKVILVSDNGTPTAVGCLDARTGEVTFGDEWYDLNGHSLGGKPSINGIYINKGKKVVLK